ncbi:MAG TPA: IS66 family transposase [Verrucomicrobiae bacterium]
MILLEDLPANVRQAFIGLESENARLRDESLRQQQIIRLQAEQIRLFNFKLYGPKSEQLSPDQMQLLQAEISLTQGEVDQEAQRPAAQKAAPRPKVKIPRPQHPGREPLPAHLERREVILPCHPQDCRCDQCGAQRPVIGYETREELGCEPAKFFVKVIKREKRGSHCLPEQGVVTAPVPAQIVPKSKLANEFIIELVVQKYQQHQPIYRQQADLADNHRIELSRKTLTDAVLAAGGLLAAVVNAQKPELLAGGYLQADETPLPCQTGEKTGHNHKAYIWEYSVPGGVVIFDFQMGRGRAGPKKFLEGFRGTVQCDGYEVYDDLGPDIVFAGCLAHARRKFVEAAKVLPLDPLPPEVVGLFGKIYGVEQEARQAGLEAAQRLALRQQKSVPLMAALKERLVAIRQQIAPGGTLAKACDYTLNQWSRLEVFLRDGRLEADNNWCEGGLRPLVLGRKNWLHIGSEQAGPKVAAIASIVETCRRLDINLRQYLNDVLPKLGDWPINRVAELTPAAWKTAHQKKS